eukprot:GHUV01018660.1.p3 GENE.GHUV01018660.1~~GHUV01018660.1.p3  ORF type:complete len:117 (+),score=16.86 GHUV01018660.1:182-532(+)
MSNPSSQLSRTPPVRADPHSSLAFKAALPDMGNTAGLSSCSSLEAFDATKLSTSLTSLSVSSMSTWAESSWRSRGMLISGGMEHPFVAYTAGGIYPQVHCSHRSITRPLAGVLSCW